MTASRLRVCLVALMGACLLRAEAPHTAPAAALKVVGYYADWTAGRYPLAGIPGGKLTHVNYAFAKVAPDSRFAPFSANALALFQQITLVKQRYPHLRFVMSVGGWTDSGPFYEMAATEASRQTFADSCADFLKSYPQFEGIDIDWEHPVVGGLQPGQPRDAHNYVLLLAAVRQAIGPGNLLTVAVSASPRGIAPLEYPEMVASLDWVSVMAYDFHTGGPRTGYNAPLYDNGDPSNPRYNVHDAVQALLAKGVPKDRLVVGVPFYGHGWKGVDSFAVWSPATGTAPSGNYKTLAAQFVNMNGFTRYWDEVAKVPWLYNAMTKEWISYDDPQSMRLKGEYVAAQQLGGAMFWELSNDDGPLLDALRAGLGTPGPMAPPR